MNHPPLASQPQTPGLRESLPITEEMYHALHSAKRVYLLLWPRDEAPHALIVTALSTTDDRFFPSNYAAVNCLLFIPPGGRHLLPEPKEPDRPAPAPQSRG